ncbi:MAG: hypothetical protein IJP93_02250, partial [Bacteroidales bacterium]|nr:hypothetical protein [Bacteroidales bacterium]
YPLWYFSSRFNRSSLAFKATGFEFGPLAKACSNGLSEFVGNISFNIVSMCYNWQLMRFYGENGVAAYSVILYLGFIFVAVYSGYNMTVTPLVGFNFGAGNKRELRSLLRHSLTLMLVLGVLLAGTAELLAGPAAKLFVGYDSELTALTVHATRLYAPSFLITGLTFFVSAWFTGLNNGPVSALASFSRTFVFELSCVFLLPVLLGVNGIWLSAPAAEILSLFLGAALLLRFRSRYGY